MSVQFDLKVANKYRSLHKSAKDRGKEFNLTITSLKNLYRAKKCYYTGVPLNDTNRSIDRVDNTKGYVIGNVVACCRQINFAKADLSTETIHLLSKKLKKRGL